MRNTQGFPPDPHSVEQLIHQFRLLLPRHIDNGLEAASCKPSGFGVGAAAAGKDQHAGIGSEHGVHIGLEAFLGHWVGKVPDVFFRLPVLSPFRS